MEITVFKVKSYNSQEWYQDLLSEFERNCRSKLELDESEIVELVSWASDGDVHCKKELVKNLHKDPHDVLIEWEDYKKEETEIKSNIV